MLDLTSKEIAESLHRVEIYNVDSMPLEVAEFLGLLIAERFNIAVKVEE